MQIDVSLGGTFANSCKSMYLWRVKAKANLDVAVTLANRIQIPDSRGNVSLVVKARANFGVAVNVNVSYLKSKGQEEAYDWF